MKKIKTEKQLIKEYKKFVVNTLSDFVEDLVLNEWRIEHSYIDDYLHQNGAHTRADVAIDTRYVNATIRTYKITFDLYKNKRYEEVKEILMHELCHILFEPLYDKIFQIYKSEEEVEDAREQGVEKVSRIIKYLIDEKNEK